MTQPCDLSIADAALLIEHRRLSPLELVDSCLDRISAVEGTLAAFIAVTADVARAEARVAEAEITAGRYRGPMHGIPYAVKDMIDIAGQQTTCHSRILADAPPATRDAGCVRRLREAGAVSLGRNALHEFAYGGPAFDLPWPPARNPWNPAHHPGGSSSGSGAAVAAGMVPAALGTDTGGSVRNPASSCGIVGMKPTFGAIGRSGVFPLSFSLDHVGPLTRTVEDNAILYQSVAGHDPDDPVSMAGDPADCLAGLRTGIRGLKVGVLEHFYTEEVPAHPEMAVAIDTAIDVLRRLGAEVRTKRLSPLKVWIACARALQVAEGYTVHEAWLKERPEDYSAHTRKRVLPGAFLPASSYVKAQQARRVLAGEMAAALCDVDVLVTVTNMDAACRLDDPAEIARTHDRQARTPFNVSGTPAMSVPIGFAASGLPFGMQIAGRAFDEATVYRTAWAYCDATGWTDRRPAPLARALPAPSPIC